ncbi:MAG: DNA-directed RNA polymerase subunit beta [Candidatus Sumerlaeia bacterium]|nr:DNA-directed RNA polymerase subunit beta [Candidatus Sumerlaeia bacterium]
MALESVKMRTRARVNYARIPEIMEMPYLIETQKVSYQKFMQYSLPPDQRENFGLQEAFTSVFPIACPGNPSTLEYIEYSFGQPKYDVKECIDRGMTYAAPLKVKLQLIVRETHAETGVTEIKDIKEQECYMGEIPLMTEQGTFIINGAERVIASQMHRSPGVSFGSSVHPNGKTLYSARVIPYRGAWVEFEIDINGVMHVMIDRKRKMPATTFLRAMGMRNDEEFVQIFFRTKAVRIDGYSGGAVKREQLDQHIGDEVVEDVIDPAKGKRIAERGAKVTKKLISALKGTEVEQVVVFRQGESVDLIERILAKDVVDKSTGEILGECWEKISPAFLRRCAVVGIREVECLDIDEQERNVIFNTIDRDKAKTYEDALIEFFRKLRPGNPASAQAGQRLIDEMFFNEKRYDLGDVGRHKINRRFALSVTGRLLTREDIVEVMKHLNALAAEEKETDDIDHLGNRRVRSVGELLQNQIRLGLTEIEKTARERMAIVDLENLLPQNLINSKPLVTAIKDFFGRSQLSQFMDQTNPLSELTHKRRLSALGPGGLSRDRAGFEVRDVHHTHYGRLCPIETPEGPNIGLISSLCTYARINEFGFIETPYRVVKSGRVSTTIEYLTADIEDNHLIAQANAPLDDKGHFMTDAALCRKEGDFPRVKPDIIEFMDVSPKQLVSVSAALIPFLEHDDANRALMGSNMQRQAVPLLFPEAPIVGTGVEAKTASDSGACRLAKNAGEVVEVSSDRVVIKNELGEEDVYHFEKYKRSNQNTCINQKPIVDVGDQVEAGDVIADGPACDCGELALGKNVVVAFMPWGGYNFEDAILLSERLVRDDVYTSIHIEEFEIDARDTKLGKEDITRDIPNVSEEALSKLDEFGLVYIGADVGPGDILVGKVTPKGETELTSEEKLLRAIFGEKAGDVRDASLKVPPGSGGTVVDIKVFSRKERGTKTEREDKAKIQKLHQDREEQVAQTWAKFLEDLKELMPLVDKPIVSYETGAVVFKPGGRPTPEALEYVRHSLRTGMLPVDGEAGQRIKRLYQSAVAEVTKIEEVFKNKEDRIKTGDELPPGVNQLVKVFVAQRRKIQVGDKMAGRHGNKGVVAKIVPIEDMPFLEDGSPVDIILNPLGVPSRMNVGQILETHLGWAAKTLGKKVGQILDSVSEARERNESLRELLTDVYRLRRKDTGGASQNVDVARLSDRDLVQLAENVRDGVPVASPVFDGAREDDIRVMLEKAGLPTSGQMVLFDGLTGEPFESPVTVGVIYMLKLAHLVDDKMHARSIGPYSLVTQQPLGGKAQFGGQRFGEMEVWALEAYGAAYTLQELLTVKSDDVTGRTKIYESIVKGENAKSPGVPESFNVLVKELQGLGLSLELMGKDELARLDLSSTPSAQDTIFAGFGGRGDDDFLASSDDFESEDL